MRRLETFEHGPETNLGISDLSMLKPITFSIAEACQITSLGRTKIYSAIRQGDLKVIKIGRRTLLAADELSAWLKANQTPTQSVHCPQANEVQS